MPLPTIAGDIPLGSAGTLGGPTPGAAAPLSFLDKIKLGYKQAGAAPDWGFNQMDWHESAVDEIRDGLRKRGITPVDPNASVGGPGEAPRDVVERHWRELLGQVAKVRASDQSFLPDYVSAVDRASFDQLVRDRRNKALGEVDAAAPDGLGLGGFLGNVLHRFKDPTSYLPVGGGASAAASVGGRILGTVLREGAANSAFAVVTEPLVRIDAAKQGQPRTMSDTLFDVGAAGVTGGAIGGVIGGVAEGWHALRRTPAPAAAPDAAPAGKAGTTGTAFDSFDAKVAKTFAEIVPENQRTPDERAAIHAIERDAEVKAASPFVPGPAGDDANAAHLDRAMSAIHGEPQSVRAVRPVARERIATPDDVAGTRLPGRELLKAKIHAVEAPNGGPNLAGGNALGPYQFEPRTWVNLFKRRYPKDTRSFDQIAALREDPHLNDVLVNDLIAENAAALRHAKFDESAGNLYLAHVLGHDRAVTVLRADPDARLADLLPPGYFKHNPFKPDQSAASLVHWAYGKMGDKTGLPVHIAEATAAEPVQAGPAAPVTQDAAIPTGRFDVEALYGDVAMTDRPVLNPDHFASPEDHSVAQVRFERDRDMAEGFAPVMSRAEAFAPSDHFGALRSYKGTVTAEAIGEALGLNPGEVRRAVGSMQATDPNSPFVLTRGRQPKYDSLGNVTREGTETGRVIRRPPRPVKQNETMLEYLTRSGGLKDVGGDLKHMGGEDWHKGAAFRRKLIDNEHGQSLDEAFSRAIDAGYFPEHNASRLGGGGYEDLPDLQDFRDAIDSELRGKPRYAVEDVLAAHDTARQALVDPEAEKAFYARQASEDAATRAERLFERTGHNQEAIGAAAERRGITLTDDEMVIDASDLIDGGMHPDEALDHAAIASAYRSLDEAAGETGNSSYAISPEERFADDGFPEQRGSGDGGDLPPDGSGGRSEGAAAAAGEARRRLEEPAHDPAAGRFSDPIGPAAEAQADSTIHDLQMEPPAEGDASTYRIDEDGGESDLASILDEIEQAQKAATEMRNCLKPKGGDE